MPGGTALEANTRDLQLLDEEVMRSVRQRDPERLVEIFYAPDAQVHIHGHSPIIGKPALLEFWVSMFHSGLVDLKVETNQFEMEHDLAYGLGRYWLTRETHPGMLYTEAGKCLVVYRRQPDGHWRAVVESRSADG